MQPVRRVHELWREQLADEWTSLTPGCQAFVTCATQSAVSLDCFHSELSCKVCSNSIIHTP